MSHPVNLVIDCVSNYMLAGKFHGSTIEIIINRELLSDKALLEFAEMLASDADKDGLFIVAALLVMEKTDRQKVVSKFHRPAQIVLTQANTIVTPNTKPEDES